MEIKIFYSKDWTDYELLDTGTGNKLERVGGYLFSRPFPDAGWARDPKVSEWEKLDGEFLSGKGGEKGKWKLGTEVPQSWIAQYRNMKFKIMPTPFRHFGFFPEQAAHWDFIEEKIKNANRKIKFLNLFGYTGVASLFALRGGAEVTHLDASRQSLAWAKENQDLNPDLSDLPMRIIEEDALKFLEREARRGNKYDCVIMDPPKFGRGPKGEIWKIEEMLPRLLSSVQKILSDNPLFVIITSYAIDASSLSLGYALEEMMKNKKGIIEPGELCLEEKSQKRLIPLANTAVWSSE